MPWNIKKFKIPYDRFEIKASSSKNFIVIKFYHKDELVYTTDPIPLSSESEIKYGPVEGFLIGDIYPL